MSKPPISSQDGIVDKLNRVLGRLMGKKKTRSVPENNKQPVGVPSNLRFLLIICSMLFVLWGLTGAYFIPDASYGVVLNNGKISKIVKGMKAGLSLPFPFSDVITLDGSVDTVKFGKSAESDPYQVLTADNQQLEISGEISYHIQNPQKYFLNYYQETSDLDQRVNWLCKTMIQDYFLHNTSSVVLHNSNAVTGNEIRQATDKILNNYGLSIDKLSISSVKKIQIESSTISSYPESAISLGNKPSALARQLIVQANQYSNNLRNSDRQLSDDFNQLLPQYRNNHKIVAELMYYKMLSSVPQAVESYPLLQLTLPQFQQMVDTSTTLTGDLAGADNANPRALNRNVNRSVMRSRWGSN